MALNKRKILDAAQKYLQKGNLDRALKEYQKVLDADPRDANVRLKMGDVQLRRGKSDEAIEAYLEVAKQFMKNGFDAKAVALFKQITKIDEKRYDIYEPLSELYQRLGLLNEAMSALQTAAEVHQREGRKKEGLALLRKMASLDPSNTATRMKIAELLWKEEMQDDALAEYDEVVAELARQGDLEGAVRVHQQVLRHLPERVENLVGLGSSELELGRAESAQVPLLKATEVSVESIEAWEALARVHEALGHRKELEDAWKTVAAIHKDRGNEDRAKEILQLYVTPEALGDEEGPGGEPPVAETSGPSMSGPEAPAPEPVEAEEDLSLGGMSGDPGESLDLGIGGADGHTSVGAAAAELDLDDEIEIELDEEVSELDLTGDAVSSSTPAAESDKADADPAQLLAEAGVYLRYSQHEKAIHCLDRILEAEPNHLEALEKLGETRQAMGDRDGALSLWKQAADHALARKDQEAFEALCERIRDLDEATADGLAAEALTPSLAAEPVPDPDLDLELEFDTPSGEPELTGAAELPALDLEMEDLLEAEPNAEAPAEDPDALLEPAEASDSGARSGGSSGHAEIPAEDLEEAEFYYRQGLHDEAEQILQRLQAMAPGHPQVLLRLGEIAKLRGECPSAPVGEGVDFDRTADDTDPGAQSLSGSDSLSDSTLEDLDGAPELGEPPAGPDDETIQVDADGLDDVDDAFEDEHGATLGGETAPSLGVVDATAADDVAGDTQGFDLAAELEDVFDDSQHGLTGDESVGGTTQAGFQSIFRSFKQGVQETLGEGEHETHFDLGIAYREMGLFEDAIGEFRTAMQAPSRVLDCLGMMALCAIDLGRAQDAVSHLEQALATPDLEPERLAGLRFDLGRAFELEGDLERTRELWEQVKAFDAGYQDVSERLDRLGQADSSPSLGVLDPDEVSGTGEALESFDDLIAEAEAGFDDDDDDPDDGPDEPGPDDSSSDMGSTHWGRKITYG